VNPAEGYAAFGDTFTFGGGAGTGYLVLDINLTGSATWSPLAAGSAVPEPGTMFALGGGLMVLAAVRRVRQARG